MASLNWTAGCLMLLLLLCAGMTYAQDTNSTMAGPEDDYQQPIVPISPGVSFNGTSAVTQANATSTPYNGNYTSNGTMSETSLAATMKTQALDAVLGGTLPCLVLGQLPVPYHHLGSHWPIRSPACHLLLQVLLQL